MIDPNNITNYNLNNYQLQKELYFWVLVAGKTAAVIAKRLELVLFDLKKLWKKDNPNKKPPPPFKLIADLCNKRKGSLWLANILKKNGIGCHQSKAKGLIQLATSKLNPKKCTIEDLEKIHGIGFKTSRCYLLHTRKDAQCAGLDTHLLDCLKSLGYNVPDATPGSKKQYLQIEKIFLNLAHKVKRSPAELDLLIWRVYSSHKHLKSMLIKILSYYDKQ